MLLDTAILRQGVDNVVGREREQLLESLNRDASVGHDEHQGRASVDAVDVEDLIATTVFSYGRELNTILVNLLLADVVIVDIGDLHEKHIVLVAARCGVSSIDIRRDHLALATVIEEEVDENGLTSVEDIKKMDLVSVAVGNCEVNGMGKIGALRMKSKSGCQHHRN